MQIKILKGLKTIRFMQRKGLILEIKVSGNISEIYGTYLSALQRESICKYPFVLPKTHCFGFVMAIP